MVERVFRDITTERLRRGVFTSVPELVMAIHPDQERSRHPAEGRPSQLALKFWKLFTHDEASARQNYTPGIALKQAFYISR